VPFHTKSNLFIGFIRWIRWKSAFVIDTTAWLY